MDHERPKRNKLFSLKYLVYDFVKVTAALPGLIWLRPCWQYENKAARKRIRGGAVLIANHVGFFDPIYIMLAVWYRRHHFVCGKEFFESKSRWWFEHFLCIPVDRGNFSMDSLRQITDELKAGSLVPIFPEGHINDGSGRIAAFKSGMVLMALQGKAPVVPVYIRPKAHWYNRVKMVIGEPVDIIARYGRRPSMQQIDEIAAELQRKEEELEQLANTKRRNKTQTEHTNN